jgi:glycosyltransferase involved in cell wall biosynthesis
MEFPHPERARVIRRGHRVSLDDSRPFLSVVIATKNRAESLRSISLPSLTKQDVANFEVIVWDASEDTASEQAVVAIASANAHLKVRYFKAPRTGLPAQRNDSIKQARGEIIFFIDDDSEISTDGIRILSEMFATDEDLAGGCLPLDYSYPINDARLATGTSRFAGRARAAYASVFTGKPGSVASQLAMPNLTEPGPKGCLIGCNMALRTHVLSGYSFNERLQRFGGHALHEDQLLSRQLHLAGWRLRVADGGLVRHHAAPGLRSANPYRKGQMEGYNASIVWKETTSDDSFLSVIAFIWARFGFFLVAFLPCLRWPWQPSRWKRLFGYLSGVWTFVFEEF